MNIISNIQWTRAINNANVRGGVIMESSKHASQIWRERTSDDVGFVLFCYGGISNQISNLFQQ